MLVLSTVAIIFLGCLDFSWSNYTSSIDGRIYGGANAKTSQFPFQALLQISTRSGVFSCGGSLISDQWVLTAAHCTEGASSIRVRLGVIDSNSNGGQTKVSTEYIGHPRYDSINVVNDIALVKLPTKVTLNSNVNTVKLPKRSEAPVRTFEGQTAVISGWGRTSNNDFRSPNNLQFARVRVMSHRGCQRYYSRYNLGIGEICTNNAVTSSGTCQGDSGGPLLVDRNGQRVQIGVTSWGVAQCQSSAPSVYTNVAAYLGFIKHNTGIPIS